MSSRAGPAHDPRFRWDSALETYVPVGHRYRVFVVIDGKEAAAELVVDERQDAAELAARWISDRLAERPGTFNAGGVRRL